MKYVITERFPDDTKIIHFVSIPGVSEPGFYRQGISIDAFKSRMFKRQFKKFHTPVQKGDIAEIVTGWAERKGLTRYFRVQFADDYEWSIKHWRGALEKLGIREEGECLMTKSILETKSHDDLWSFYKSIGYDYKSGKFPCPPISQ